MPTSLDSSLATWVPMVIFAQVRNGEHEEIKVTRYQHALYSIACHSLVHSTDTPLICVCPRECNFILTSRTTHPVPISRFEVLMVYMFSNDQLYSIR